MERDGQLDHAEPGAEMPAGDRDRRDRLRAQFVGELAELILVQLADVGGNFDRSSNGVRGTSLMAGPVNLSGAAVECWFGAVGMEGLARRVGSRRMFRMFAVAMEGRPAA